MKWASMEAYHINLYIIARKYFRSKILCQHPLRQGRWKCKNQICAALGLLFSKEDFPPYTVLAGGAEALTLSTRERDRLQQAKWWGKCTWPMLKKVRQCKMTERGKMTQNLGVWNRSVNPTEKSLLTVYENVGGQHRDKCTFHVWRRMVANSVGNWNRFLWPADAEQEFQRKKAVKQHRYDLGKPTQKVQQLPLSVPLVFLGRNFVKEGWTFTSIRNCHTTTVYLSWQVLTWCIYFTKFPCRNTAVGGSSLRGFALLRLD